jgi:hypothetical protein
MIMYYDPVLISEVHGGGPFEWPTIFVRTDAVSLLGSAKALHEFSGKLYLAAMDLRSFFCPINEYIIRQEANAKTIIVLTAA